MAEIVAQILSNIFVECVTVIQMTHNFLYKVLPILPFTVWKFHDFQITQILREINFRDSRSAKFAIKTLLEAPNFDFDDYLHFMKTEKPN